MIKYFCDDCNTEIDVAGQTEIIENDRLDWGKRNMTIYPSALSVGEWPLSVDSQDYCVECSLKRFSELQTDDFNNEIWE
tara:strand:+ start:770 stop:1006 length:237 start_codon:yes stop_codon:yes gene_type:complete